MACPGETLRTLPGERDEPDNPQKVDPRFNEHTDHFRTTMSYDDASVCESGALKAEFQDLGLVQWNMSEVFLLGLSGGGQPGVECCLSSQPLDL